jgi:disease resistance protein RPM1
VVDDIWNHEVWKLIDYGLGASDYCVVLLTSRITDVGHFAGGTVYTLEPLSVNFSRELFYKKIFGSEHKCPPELEDISGNLLEKCNGIPLAIITTSNLLASQKLTTEAWQAVHDSNYFADSDGTKRILGPSYTNLSPYLKSCLLYLSMFEKGSVISVDRLIWGWITEGFVIQRGNMEYNPIKLQEIGEYFLHELINRNLIVLVGIDAVCVYKFIHEWIVLLSSEENFAVILDGRKEKSLPEIVYRLSIQGNTTLPIGRLCRARSLVAYGDAKLMPPLSEFKNLRVLDIAGCRDTLQNDHLAGITNSFFLKYLVIGGKHITDIPKEIGNLPFLQTLDLKESSVKELTESVFLLRHLKCLWVNGRTKISTGIGKLESLEELGDINISKKELLEELCNLTRLRVLRMSIWSWDESYSEALFGYLHSLLVNKSNMQILAIMTTCSLHSLDKLNAEPAQAPLGLQKLEISQSAFNTVPRWISSFRYSLRSLSVEVYKLSQEIIDMLGELVIIRALSLTSKHAPDGWFGAESMPSLGSFHFVSNAMGKIFGPGSMRHLERLKLSFQASRTKDEFKAFDFGLENLSTLQHVSIEINCFSATIKVVDDAEAVIRKTINTEDLEILKVREKDMLETEVLQVHYFYNANN